MPHGTARSRATVPTTRGRAGRRGAAEASGGAGCPVRVLGCGSGDGLPSWPASSGPVPHAAEVEQQEQGGEAGLHLSHRIGRSCNRP